MLKGRFFGEYQSIQITTGSNVIAESDSSQKSCMRKGVENTLSSLTKYSCG